LNQPRVNGAEQRSDSVYLLGRLKLNQGVRDALVGGALG